jgi:hypothetical protein
MTKLPLKCLLTNKEILGSLSLRRNKTKSGKFQPPQVMALKKTKKSKEFQKSFNNGVQIKTNCFLEDQTSPQHSSPIEPK